MSVHPNENLARQLYEAFNARKVDQAAKLVSDNFEWLDVATGETYGGKAGLRQFMEMWTGAFKDAKIDIRRIVATDDVVVSEIVARGTHTGPIEMSGNSIPATHKPLELACCEVARIENGRIRSGSTYYDLATVMSQLGLMESVGAHK